jgi:hypothetical protein
LDATHDASRERESAHRTQMGGSRRLPPAPS